MAREQRRLAAIVSADVAGYSRLMGQDEGGTLAALKSHRRELVDRKVAEHHGRLVNTAGDGLLLEFASVVDAVRCSVEVQRAMAERNAAVPEDARIEFRVGINVGDIIIDGEDIYGDGVNVAARLQALANPGGICVSRAVRDQVLDKLSFIFEDMGAQQVKNIARPIEVYRVRDVGPGTGHRTVHDSSSPARSSSVASAPSMSVAILPFTSTGDGSMEFADRLTRDLGMGLARGSQAVVVASHTAAERYGEKPIDERAVGQDLNVRYLAEGEVRSASERRIVSIQLIDVSNASQAWSRRLELAVKGPDSDETAFTRRLTSQVRGALFNAEARRFAAGGASGVGARDLVWRAMSIASPGTLTAIRDAGKLLDEALRLEPTLVPALNNRAFVLLIETELDPRADYARLTQQADDLSGRAVSIDNDDAFAWMTRSRVLGYEGRFNQALAAIALAQRLDPTRQYATAYRAWLQLISGEPQKSLASLEEARAVFPDELDLELRIACWANLNLGQYDSAIALGEKAAGVDTWYFNHLLLAAAYANKGDAAKAAAAKAELDKRVPGYTIRILKSKGYSSHPNYVQQAEAHLYPGLREAGVPEK